MLGRKQWVQLLTHRFKALERNVSHKTTIVRSSTKVAAIKKPINYIPKRTYFDKVDIRDSLKPLIKRIHPDLFSDHPAIQAENDESLKKINGFLDMVEDMAKDENMQIVLDKNKTNSTINVVFYVKPKQKSTFETVRMIRSHYAIPASYFETPFEARKLLQDCYVFLNSLLKQAGLPLIPLTGIKDDLYSNYEVAQGKISKPARSKERDKFMAALGKTLNRHYPYVQMAHDKTGGNPRSKLASIASGVHLLDKFSYQKEQIHYSTHLDGEQRIKGLIFVQGLWSEKTLPLELPVLITDVGEYYDPDVAPGIVTIPYAATKSEIDAYLVKNLSRILRQHSEIVTKLEECEYHYKQWKEIFNLSGIRVKCTLDEALDCLITFEKIIKDLLNFYFFEGMTFVITKDQLKLDIVDHIFFVPFDIKEQDLLAYLEKNRNLLQMRYRMYPTKAFRNSMSEALYKIKQIIECKDIIVSTSIICMTQKQIRGLHSMSSGLTSFCKYNLSNFTIILSDAFDYNGQEYMLTIPYNFTPEELENFVNKFT